MHIYIYMLRPVAAEYFKTNLCSYSKLIYTVYYYISPPHENI